MLPANIFLLPTTIHFSQYTIAREHGTFRAIQSAVPLLFYRSPPFAPSRGLGGWLAESGWGRGAGVGVRGSAV